MRFSSKAMRAARMFMVWLVAAAAILGGRAALAAPPYWGTIFIDPDIILASDPTSYQSLEEKGRGVRVMFDRRANNWVQLNAYLFEASFDDGLRIEVQVNPEFGSVASARTEALRYMHAVGQLPTALRAKVQTMWLHKGNQPFGGGNNNILIHSEQADQYIAEGILEETLMHEAAHTSLDPDHASAAGWIAAQRADPEFISTYAKDNPTREDVAETFVPYFAVQYRRDRIEPSMAQTIVATIPNRIAYLNAQNFNMHPVQVAVAPPQPTITLHANITADDVINIAESEQTIAVSGTVGGDAVVGDPVSLTVNGKRFSTLVTAGMSFTVTLPGIDLVADGDLTIEALVTSTSAGGAIGTASDSESYTYDLTLPAAPELTLASASPEDPAKTTVSTPGIRVTFIGAGLAASAPGDRVRLYEQGVEVGNATVTSAHVAAGFIEIQTTPLANGIKSFTAIITDAAGNASDPSASLIVTVDASLTQPFITVAPVTADNVINAREATEDIRVFGSVQGAAVGDPVTLTVGQRNFAQNLGTGGTFNFTVAGQALVAAEGRQIEVVVRTASRDGAVAIGVRTHEYGVDFVAPGKPMVDLDSASDTGSSAEDNITSDVRPRIIVRFAEGTEANGRFEFLINGVVGITAAITTVDASRGSVEWRSAVDLQGQKEFRAIVVDAAGNASGPSDPLLVSIITEAPTFAVTLATVTEDNVINLRESTNAVEVSGSATARAGDSVAIHIGADSFTTTLDAQQKFAVRVPGMALVNSTNRLLIASVTSSNLAGNATTVSVTNRYEVDRIAPMRPILDLGAAWDSGVSAEDNYTSNTAPTLIIPITDGSAHDAQEGDWAVLFESGVEIDRKAITGATIGRGEIGFALAGLQHGVKTFAAALVDAAGNVGGTSAPLAVTIDTAIEAAEFLPFAPISNDGMITGEDLNRNVLIAGSIHVEDGVTPVVTVSLSSRAVSAIVSADTADASLFHFEIALPGAELAAEPDRIIRIAAEGTDRVGNRGQWATSLPYRVEIESVTAPRISGVTLDAATGKLTARWTSQAGRTYRLESSDNLLAWEAAGEPIVGLGGEAATQVEIVQTVKAKFLRLRTE